MGLDTQGSAVFSGGEDGGACGPLVGSGSLLGPP